MFLFQLPRLPELLIARQQAIPFVKAIAATARRGAFSREELDQLREAWLQPGALTGMINWYRAAFRHQPSPPPSPRVKVPMMLIWGARDHALGRQMAPESIELCDQGRLEVIEEATHWVQHEEPERVNALILEWLAQHQG
jgi:pimeloyl-ACP methyl ester carboxylesterase